MGIGCTLRILRPTEFEERRLLTNRQAEIINLVLERRYFGRPKKINSHDLAKLTGVSPAAISEIIRPAERRVLQQHMPAISGRECVLAEGAVRQPAA